MSVTSTGTSARLRAAARPPKPAPTMTTWGRTPMAPPAEAREQIHEQATGGRPRRAPDCRDVTRTARPPGRASGSRLGELARDLVGRLAGPQVDDLRPPLAGRSEEHTSELQSRENLVCRLL